MKTKLLSAALLAAVMLPSMASAQSTGELRRDRQDIRQEERDLRQARRTGTPHDVRDERGDVRDARQEYREDWQDHRRNHREDYRGGTFRAPFRYHSFGNGVRISGNYIGPRYQVNNVSRWRLPAAGRGQVYVRHYNDLLLVNQRSGTVARVYRNFYW